MAKRTKSSATRVNQGIQANKVTSEVVAVGSRAKAIKVVKSGAQNEELIKAIVELRHGLDALKLNSTARAAVEDDVRALDNEAKKKNPDSSEISRVLQSLAGKLKMVGVVFSEVVSLSEPVKKIAELAAISLKMLGLG